MAGSLDWDSDPTGWKTSTAGSVSEHPSSEATPPRVPAGRLSSGNTAVGGVPCNVFLRAPGLAPHCTSCTSPAAQGRPDEAGEPPDGGSGWGMSSDPADGSVIVPRESIKVVSMSKRHPNQKSTWEVFQGQRRKAADPKKEAVSSIQDDLKALEAVQATRPAKPPGRR